MTEELDKREKDIDVSNYHGDLYINIFKVSVISITLPYSHEYESRSVDFVQLRIILYIWSRNPCISMDIFYMQDLKRQLDDAQKRVEETNKKLFEKDLLLSENQSSKNEMEKRDRAIAVSWCFL